MGVKWARPMLKLLIHMEFLAMDLQRVVEAFLLAENRLLRDALIRLLNKKGDIRVVGASPYSRLPHTRK